jgi:hypothetical protein
MNKTHGDTLYSPTTNGPTINELIYRQSPEDSTGGASSSKSYGEYNPPRGEVGWICPVCGRGLAPSTSYCPCNLTKNITYLNGGLSVQDKAIDCKSVPPEAYYITTAINGQDWIKADEKLHCPSGALKF